MIDIDVLCMHLAHYNSEYIQYICKHYVTTNYNWDKKKCLSQHLHAHTRPINHCKQNIVLCSYAGSQVNASPC